MKACLKLSLKYLCKFLFRVRLTGQAHIPQRPERMLVVANHESFLDGLLLGLFLPFNATFVVHTSVLQNSVFRLILGLVPHLAVDPSSPLAMKKVIKLLEANQNVVIFPEGRLTLTGSLMKVYEGPAFVAAKTGATILPIRLDGTARSYFSRVQHLYPKKWLPAITLTILPSTQIAMPLAPTAKARRKLAGEAMRRLMQNMLFASYPVKSLFSAFLDAVDVHGRRWLLIEDMQQIKESYGDLLKKALALGRMVSKISAPNEAVGVLLPNVTNTACIIFGMSAMQRVPAMLNYTAGSAGIQNACTAAQIKHIVSARKFIETAKLEDTLGALQGIEIHYLEDMRQQFGWRDKLWLLAYALWLPRCVEKAVQPDDTAVILFTSGSEGKPKGVVHSHRSILANVAQICAVIDFSPRDKFMMVLPLFHAFGFTCGAILPMVRGTQLFLYPTPLHYKVIPEVIYDKACTVLFGTSTFLGHYAKNANPYDFYSLRYVIAGAEKLNEEVRRVWADKFGIRILEGYGSTECAPVLAVNTPMANLNGSVGNLLPGIEARMQPVPGVEAGGILQVRGSNIMKGYFFHDQPGAIQPPQDGWYDTGDVVNIDENGFVKIVGRVKRFAKIAGEMVSLETVEKLATVSSPQFEHAASSQPDSSRGEAIVLFTTDPAMSREQLLHSAKSQGIPELAVPRKIVVLANLPLLGTGKTDYVQLKQMASEA